MVAKSYQSYPLLGDPFAANGRMYVNVQTPKGQSKTVRWYTDAEYAKLYGAPIGSSTPTFNAKKALGFSEGPITIFKGYTDALQDYFEASPAYYNAHWGWYYPSGTTPIYPPQVTPVSLQWASVGKADNTLKPIPEVRAAVDSLLYEASPSKHQGKIGERIERVLTVKEVKKKNNGFGGVTTFHTFADAEGNIYSWATSSKSWEVGSTKVIRGTVKEFVTTRNINITALTRCAEKS